MPKRVRAILTSTYKVAVAQAIRALKPLCSPGKTQIHHYCSIHSDLKDPDLLSHYVDLFVASGDLTETDVGNCTRYQLRENRGGTGVSMGPSGSAAHPADSHPRVDARSASAKTTSRILSAVRTVSRSTNSVAVATTLIQKELARTYPFTRLKGSRLEKRLKEEVASGRLELIGDCYAIGPDSTCSEPTSHAGTKKELPRVCHSDQSSHTRMKRPRKSYPRRLDCLLTDHMTKRNAVRRRSRSGEDKKNDRDLPETSKNLPSIAAADHNPPLPVRISTRIRKRTRRFEESKLARRTKDKEDTVYRSSDCSKPKSRSGSLNSSSSYTENIGLKVNDEPCGFSQPALLVDGKSIVEPDECAQSAEPIEPDESLNLAIAQQAPQEQSGQSDTDMGDLFPAWTFSLTNGSRNWSHLAGLRKAITPGLEKTAAICLGEVISQTVGEWKKSQRPVQSADQVATISAWTAEEIAAKFQQKGHQLYAEVVIRHMIDGAALLLLLRDDVISRLGLPLGPGLKMWRELCDIASWD